MNNFKKPEKEKCGFSIEKQILEKFRAICDKKKYDMSFVISQFMNDFNFKESIICDTCKKAFSEKEIVVCVDGYERCKECCIKEGYNINTGLLVTK